MTKVNGFDIDTPEGATAYLESEGIDVEEYVRRGIDELKRSKALDLANVSKTFCECDKPQPNYPEMVWCDNCTKEIKD